MAKKDFKIKVQEEFPEFVNEVARLQITDLERRLSTYAKEANKVEEAKEADEALAEARATASEYAAPYKEAKNAIKLKSKYIISMIKDKGGDA